MLWLGLLTYSLFDFPHVEVVPTLWGTPSLSPLLVVCILWLLYLLACHSVPKLVYLEIMQMLPKDLDVHLSLQEVSD